MTSAPDARSFIPLNIAVLTISDTRSLDDDKSGTTLSDRLVAAGHKLAARGIVSDDVEAIRSIFNTGNIVHPYDSVNIHVNKRIQRLEDPV